MFSQFELKRIRRLIDEYIDSNDLNLDGLTLFTEAASGYYLFTSLMASLAKAKMVYAFTKDSKWGSASDIEKKTYDLAREWNCSGAIEVITAKTPELIGESDIIMNTGFVRPIDSEMVRDMKKTAVIPLMYETWEVRPGEIDLEACEKRDILVMGTDEEKQLNRFQYSAYLSWYLMFQKKIEVFKNKLFYVSSGAIGQKFQEVYNGNNLDFKWTSFDPDQGNDMHYINMNDKRSILDFITKADVFVCCEHRYDKPVIAHDGIITPEELYEANDSILLIYLCGTIDFNRIISLGIEIYPSRETKFGTYTVYPYELGPRAVLELTASGLKVGETMARSRIDGKNIDEAKEYALKHSMAMEF
ncbi:MAG: hypothetical protein GY721_12140 [Deltaproteobacteria bacterium]|nr:hypothetical protein [Deltaproteobacteria bacterium]